MKTFALIIAGSAIGCALTLGCLNLYINYAVAQAAIPHVETLDEAHDRIMKGMNEEIAQLQKRNACRKAGGTNLECAD